MALLSAGGNFLTLAQWAKRQAPDQEIDVIVEMLSQRNEVLTDMKWKEGNLPTGERTTARTSLPTPSDRIINSGVVAHASTTEQFDEQTAVKEDWCDIDEELARLGGNVNALRLSEYNAFLEGFNQAVTKDLFYANGLTSPNKILGFTPRYNDATLANAQNILNGGGVGSVNTSVWLIFWTPEGCHGLFPKGTKAGMEHTDWGKRIVQQVVNTPDGGIGMSRLVAWSSQFKWHFGLTIKDWRYAVRICNIDVNNLVRKSGAADLVELMIRATHRIPNLKASGAAFYMNRTVAEMLDIQRRSDVQLGGQLKYEVVDGEPLFSFRGTIPIRICDQLVLNEATVTGLPALS
jgi:hypothetical protein